MSRGFLEEFLLVLVFILCAVIVVRSFLKRNELVQFPFLTAAAFLAYVFPQLVAVVRNDDLPEAAVEKTLLMSVLCLSAAFVGYLSNRKAARIGNNWDYNYRRLIVGIVALTLLGALSFYKVGDLAIDEDLGSQWSGPITIYFFFGQLLTVGLVLALVVHMKRPSWVTLAVVVGGMAFYLHRGVILGRRGEMAEFVLMVGVGLYLRYRWVPPRAMVIAMLAAGTLWINAIGDYRSEVVGGGDVLSAVSSIDFVGNLRSAFDDAPDVINAVYAIDAADRDLSFNYGLRLYNDVIMRYVPGQIIGRDLKESLKSGIGELEYAPGYHFRTGTTNTGMGWAFQTLWYLGAVWFYAIGVIMNRWFRAATQGSLVGSVVVILVYYQSLVAFSFSPAQIFLRLIFLMFSLAPVLCFARLRPRVLNSV